MMPLLSLMLLAAPALAGTQRVALLAGANDGGRDRVPLQYAVDDAEALGGVLRELGGFEAQDVLLLADPDLGELEAGLAQLQSLIRDAHAAGDRAEAIVYYSGHSDELGLRLSGDELLYDELRASLESLGADVTVLILDSCASGAMVRGKGGVHQAPFLSDESVQVSGYAYLTSASADEAAQEADRISGSYFTHALVTGLRGGADSSGDGRVTLNEAYQFAYGETLSLTERTIGGAQHANYDIRLMGTGDLVLTDVNGASASLAVDASLAGRLFIRDARGGLVAELNKPAGRVLELGLAPGRYEVLLEDGGFLGEARVDLVDGGRVSLTRADFKQVSVELAQARGDLVYTRIPFNIGVWPLVSFSGLREGPYLSNVDLSLGVSGTDKVHGLQAGVGAAFARDGVVGAELAAGGVVSAGDLRGLQAAAGVAATRGDLEGVQGAAGVAVTSGDLRGLQAAAGGVVTAGDLRGLQAAAGFAVTGGELTGLQAAAGVVGAERVRGAQLSAGLAVAEEVDGLQAGIVSVAKRVDGLQLGLVNVAGQVDGAQLGLVNIAQDVDGPTLGLVVIHPKGYNTLSLGASESSAAAMTLTYGGKRVYSLVEAGVRPLAEGIRLDSGLGLGLHSPLSPRLALDVDLAAISSNYSADWSAPQLAVRSRALVDVQLVGPLHAYAGPSLSGVVLNTTADPYALTIVPSWSPLDDEGLLPVWVGLSVGLRLRLSAPKESMTGG